MRRPTLPRDRFLLLAECPGQADADHIEDEHRARHHHLSNRVGAGDSTAPTMNMMRIAYFMFRIQEAGRDDAHPGQEQHQRRHLEDEAKGQHQLHVEAERGSMRGMNDNWSEVKL
jgi:hypothetical protein